jgi:hypothetical protein
MRRLLLCVIVASAACGGSEPVHSDAIIADSDAGGVDPNDGARSGSRLKLTWFEFLDGSRWYRSTFYDAQRKEGCSIYSWLDGSFYCTPDAGGSIVYTNAGCTQKIIQVYRDLTCPQPVPTYALEYGGAGGGCTYGPTHLYLRGAVTGTPANYYYLYSDGSCGGPFSSGTSYDYYQPNAEVTDLVKITPASSASVARLGETFYASSDGFRFPGPVHDAMLGTDCYAQSYTQEATAGLCVPSAAYAGYNHDAQCTQRELEYTSTCPKPAYSAYYDPNACPSDPGTFYATGAQIASSPLYTQTTTACVAATPSTGQTYYQMGPAVTPASLDRVADTTANHRLQLVHYTTPDGLRVRDYYLRDTTKQADCYPTTQSDGTTRCIPYGGYAGQYYANASCTQPIDLVQVSTGPASCAAPTVPKFARKYLSTTCTFSLEVRPVTTPYAGAIYTGPSPCTLYTPSRVKMYSVGAALPITDFMSATVSTDP